MISDLLPPFHHHCHYHHHHPCLHPSSNPRGLDQSPCIQPPRPSIFMPKFFSLLLITSPNTHTHFASVRFELGKLLLLLLHCFDISRLEEEKPKTKTPHFQREIIWSCFHRKKSIDEWIKKPRLEQQATTFTLHFVANFRFTIPSISILQSPPAKLMMIIHLIGDCMHVRFLSLSLSLERMNNNTK